MIERRVRCTAPGHIGCLCEAPKGHERAHVCRCGREWTEAPSRAEEQCCSFWSQFWRNGYRDATYDDTGYANG